MSSPINAQLTGTFTSDGSAFNLSLPSGYTEIELTNMTDIGSAAAATPVMKAWGTSSMDAGEAIYATKTNGAATIAIPTTTTSNGFTFLSDTGAESLGAANATITAISQADPGAVSLTSTTGLGENDVVRLYNTTGMLQVAGMDFSIDTIVANTSFNLTYLDSSGFAAAATAGTLRRVASPGRYLPRWRHIMGITQASSAVIALSVTHQYVAGQAVRIKVPAGWGMTEIDGLIGNITAVSTANNTITVDIDSSAFTAFAFPTSAVAAAGIDLPMVVPVGETANDTYANNLADAVYNNAITGVTIGTSVQTTGKLYQWVARRSTAI